MATAGNSVLNTKYTGLDHCWQKAKISVPDFDQFKVQLAYNVRVIAEF